MVSYTLSFVLLQLLPATIAAFGPSGDLLIGNRFISPDGFNRSAVLAGSSRSGLTFPGPVIVANRDDRFNLNVIDQLTDPTMLRTTSIHWHGLFQRGTQWADGPAGVTQCPITPGSSFLYQFQPRNQAGTFWYHSHHQSQYCDGLRGALVLYDRRDPLRYMYDVDDESTIITLADWYHVPAPSAGAVPTPDSTLINGKGRYAGGPPVALSVVNVVRDRRYRFRLISISCDPNFVFSIDGHQLTVIEVDGESVQPHTVDNIQIFVGQRYSVVLNANRPVGNYWIRAEPNIGTTGFAGGVNSAILRYRGAPATDPVSDRAPFNNRLNEANLRNLRPVPAPGIPRLGAADVNINLDIAFDPNTVQFSVNNATMLQPPVPILLQILSGARTPQELMPQGSVYVLPRNKVIEISIPGGSVGTPHPIHFHGHLFSVVRSAGSNVYNYANPVRRDVVNIGESNDNVTIRFLTDNAGPWILHCHIDWHLVLGLSVVFAEDVPTIAGLNPPQAWDDLCPKYEASGLD
ncbi:laccase 13 [Coprinopsis marcescibilis]|uniref:Laccase 13 n=1 Tax=Coprinopsis marcescibilis TaxID=230819 RepID=A0A5C3KCU4_COPMA|nr:laccase 13 [Coprinopsis marcescibilis]